ncbi:LAGLIDADG family homing endonuclease [Candidatus Woesearchaeota archaeon]|nr:LAGLIDADG family homing endonuclease [Candidatus Woesearchaeota archaeon]
MITNEEKIIHLYKQGRPLRELARNFLVDRTKIRKLLHKKGIAIKPSRDALLAMGHIQEKERFNLDIYEKAYLYGLVGGDLTPVRKSNYTLKLITHSTHMTFIDLLYRTFSKYGPASYKETKNNDTRFQSHIDLESFSFLLGSKASSLPDWINQENFYEFLAGYIDADGSVMIKKIYGNFQFIIRLCGENFPLLLQIKTMLQSKNYSVSIHKNHSKGDNSYQYGKLFQYNKDYYVIDVYRKEESLDLLQKLPLRHPEKIAKKELIFSIAQRGLVKWKDVENEVIQLRERIQRSVQLKKCLKEIN